MQRQEAVSWLNHRLSHFNKLNRHNHFDMEDILFIMSFIKHRTGDEVTFNQVKDSIVYFPKSCLSWIERLTNYLVKSYDINMVIQETQNMEMFTDFLGIPRDSHKVIKYE